MKSTLFGFGLALLAVVRAWAWSGETWAPITRATIKSNADVMIDSTWVANNSFTNYQYGSTYQPYTKGTLYKGVAYSQNNPQENWQQFLNAVSTTAGGSVGYGNDCSGFVSICWKLPNRYTTASFESQLGTYWTSLGDVGSSASVALVTGDGINSSASGHIIMFLNYEGTGIRSMEQTPDNAQRRAWSYSALAKYRPIRRLQIDEQPIPQPPVVISDLVCKSLDAGDPLALSVSILGTNVTYRWYLNGALIPASNTNRLLLGTAQLTNAGLYLCIASNGNGMVTSRVSTVSVAGPHTTVFLENFEADTAANWVLSRSSDDTRITFGWDYSTLGVPMAPASTTGGTRGVRMEANMTLGVVAAVSMSPRNLSFAGDYRLRFDMWINANGPFPGGGTGSTESLTAGIGTAGNSVHWTATGSTADGYWFLANAEGGATDTSTTSGDFCAFAGPVIQNPSTGCYAAGMDNTAKGNNNAYYTSAFPSGLSAPSAQKAAYPQQAGALASGTLGFAWHDVIIARHGSSVDWIIDGVRLATITNATFAVSNIFVGYWDSYASISDNPNLSFGLVDNVRVQAEAVAPVMAMTKLENGDFQVEANCSPGHYAIESTADLTHWVETTNFFSAGGTFRRIEPSSGAFRRFYRIRVLP